MGKEGRGIKGIEISYHRESASSFLYKGWLVAFRIDLFVRSSNVLSPYSSKLIRMLSSRKRMLLASSKGFKVWGVHEVV